MRNPELAKLDGLLGEWSSTLSDAWFLEPAGTEVSGRTTVELLGESLLSMRITFDAGAHQSWMSFVIGRSDPNDTFVALYQDDRGVCRQFAMTFDGTDWTMSRTDPDMHQRFVAVIEQDRIRGRWEASEDQGATWRKDYDLTFERA